MSLFDMQCGNAWLQWYYQAKVCQNNKYNLSVILSEILSPSLPKNSNQNTLCMWNSFAPIFTWKRNKYFYYFLSLCYLLCDLLILISLSLSIFHCKRTGTWWDILFYIKLPCGLTIYGHAVHVQCWLALLSSCQEWM